MSSFSSVVRKPGGKIAPKVAPRRNIVRKAATAAVVPEASQQESQSTVQTLDVPSVSALPSDGQVEQREVSDVDVNTASHDTAAALEPSSAQEHALQEATQDDEVPAQSSQREVAVVEPPSVTSPINASNDQDVTTGEPEASTLPSWPSQKPRPARNASMSRTRKSNQNSPQTPAASSSTEAVDRVNNEPAREVIATNSPPAASTTTTITKSRSKRKQQPRAGIGVLLSQSTAEPPTPPTTQPSRTPTRERAPSVASRRAQSVSSRRSEPQSEAEEAFQSIAETLQKMRELTASIDPQRASEASENAAAAQSEGRPSKRRRKNGSAPTSVEQRAEAVVADAVGDSDDGSSRGRRRKRTPEDPENHRIEPENTMMDDLLSSRHKWGKKSDKEKEIEANWQEILRRRKDDADARFEAAQQRQSRKQGLKGDQSQKATNENHASTAAQVQVENGQVVIVTREIDRTQEAEQALVDTDATAVLEDIDIYKRVNSSTIGSKQRIRPGQHWDEVTVDLFYKGLQMFGTDFAMIASMIPGKNRKQVKLKYNVEERSNWSRIKWCLGNRVAVDLSEYKTATGREDEWADAAQVYKDMEEEEKRLREEDEARRRQEGIVAQRGDNEANPDADIAMPSIEEEDATNVDVDAPVAAQDRQSTAGVSRVGSTTTARQTTQPTAKRKQTKKSASTSKRGGRQAANKHKGFEGVEERLGGVDEIGIPVS